MKDIQFQQINTQLKSIANKLTDHDGKFINIDERFDKLTSLVELIAQTVAGHDQKFELIDRSFDIIDGRFNRIDSRLEHMTSALVIHDKRLSAIEDNYVTKKEFRELMNSIDFSVKSVMNMKEDHVFGVEWMKRMQDQLGWHEQDIRKLKLQLNLA